MFRNVADAFLKNHQQLRPWLSAASFAIITFEGDFRNQKCDSLTFVYLTNAVHGSCGVLFFQAPKLHVFNTYAYIVLKTGFVNKRN